MLDADGSRVGRAPAQAVQMGTEIVRQESLRRRLTLVGTGLISTTLGIAVQASELEGQLITVGAWSAVGCGVLATGVGAAIPLFRRSAPVASAAAVPQLATRLGALGTRIIQFKHDRDAGRPATPPFRLWAIVHPLRAIHDQQAHHASERAYDADTMSLYRSRFGVEVRAMVKELVEQEVIGSNEALTLLRPANPWEVERIGNQLISLGQLLSLHR